MDWFLHKLLSPFTFSNIISTAQKRKFSIKNFFSKCDQTTGNCENFRLEIQLLVKKIVKDEFGGILKGRVIYTVKSYFKMGTDG